MNKKHRRFSMFLLLIIILFSFCANASADKFVIVGSSDIDLRMKYMETWLAENYSDMTTEYLQLDSEALETQLMSGTGKIDIVLDNASLVWDYVKGGAFLPIDELPEVLSAINDSGFVPYQQALSFNGNVYGIPSAILFYVTDINEELLATLGLTLPVEPWTWETLSEWAINYLTGTGYYLCSRIIGADPVGQYIDAMVQRDETITLNTEEFRKIMTIWKSLYTHGLINTQQSGDQSRCVLQFHYILSPDDELLPAIDELSVQTAEIISLFVNINSEHIEVINEWLKTFVSFDCQHLAWEDGAPHMLLSSIRAQDLERFSSITLKHRNPYLIGALGYSSIMQQYLDGLVSLDTYIELAQNKMDVIQFE